MPKLAVEIVKRSDQAKGFIVLPKRWVVERTLAWLGRCRRLAKDFENLTRNAFAFIHLASIRLHAEKALQSSLNFSDGLLASAVADFSTMTGTRMPCHVPVKPMALPEPSLITFPLNFIFRAPIVGLSATSKDTAPVVSSNVMLLRGWKPICPLATRNWSSRCPDAAE